MDRSILYIADILEWAKEFHKCHGRWPMRKDGRIAGKTFTWNAVDVALNHGKRGLRGGSTLAKLFLRRFGRRHRGLLQDLTIEQILAWADAHHKRTKAWPLLTSGRIAGAPGETWHAVQAALSNGARGLPGGSSLAQLLAQHRDVRNRQGLAHLTAAQILDWADAFHAKTGIWPTKDSGDVASSSGETWRSIDNALRLGYRDMAKGGSLPRLLAQHRGVRNSKALPKLRVPSILNWADAHYERTSRWPTHLSGPVPEAPGETWSGVHAALYSGTRGLPGGDSLSRLLKRHGRRSERIQSRQ